MNRTWHCLRQQRFEQGRHAIVPVQPAHIESIRRWRNAQLDVLRQNAPITPQQQEAYFAKHIWPTMASAEPVNILMALLLDNVHIGYGGLVHVNWAYNRAELSFLVDPVRAISPRRYAADFSAFIALAQQMAFDDLRLHRVFTETYAIRQYHIDILEAAGFVQEGVMRNHCRIGSAFVDSILHGLIRVEPCSSPPRTAAASRHLR